MDEHPGRDPEDNIDGSVVVEVGLPLFLLCLSAAGNARSAVFRVPRDRPGIQAAINETRTEGNVLANNGKAGLGCMANGGTSEDFAGAPLVEPVKVIGNTFSGNPHGLTGGDNMLVMNNIVVGTAQIGVKRVAASSLVTHNDSWGNGADYSGSNVDTGTTLLVNPMLDTDYELMTGSPSSLTPRAVVIK